MKYVQVQETIPDIDVYPLHPTIWLLSWVSSRTPGQFVYNMQKKAMTLNLYTSDAIVLITVSQVTTDMTIWDQSNDGAFVSGVYHIQCNPSSQN